MRANGEHLEYVQKMVACGEYRIDPQEVAAAMLDRIGARTAGRQAVSRREGGHDPMRELTGLQAA